MLDNKVQPDPIARLYNNIKKEYDLPDFNTFKADMSDSNKAKRLHATLVSDGYEIPDYDVFSVDMGLKKKDGGVAKSDISGILSNPTELPLSFTKNNVQEPVVQNPDPFDKNANPAVLARQSYELKKPKEAKENVSVTAMGLPVISYSKKYDENDINVSKEIDKYLEESGYSKDFVNQVSRIPESYRQSTGYTDQDLSDLYKSDRNQFNKRTSEVLFREQLASGMNDIKASIIRNNNLTQEQKDAQIGKIQDEEFLQNQEAMSIGSGFKNKQYFIGQTAKRIKEFIGDPEKKREALEDLATYAADDFGSLEDLEDKKNNPISPNINEEQSVALNYLEQIDPSKAEFYKKYINVDKNQLKNFEYKGYQQIFKELDEIGLSLSINSAQNEIKPLVDLAQEQGGRLDPVDYEKYNKLLETINLASTRLAKIDQIYPDATNLDIESIAQDLVGGRTSTLGIAGRKLMYGLAKTGKGIVDLAATPFRTQQENDNAALEALGIENYIAPTTTPTSKNSLLARGEAKLTPELEKERQSIEKDSSLSQDQKVDKMSELLKRNPDKWTRPSEETSINVGVNTIVSSLLNFTADIAPFIALETLTAGGATSAAGYGVVRSFGKMFANVALTSYSDELARQLKEKNPNPEQAAYANILVNSIAYKVAGVGDILKGVRNGAKELGGFTEKVISKLDDKAILAALEKPNPTLKSFFSDLGKTVVQSGKKGFKTGLTFETVIGAKEVLEGAKIDSEFMKSRLVGLLNFTLFNVATRAPFSMPKIDKQSKEALFLAAKNKDQFLYEAEKSFANKQISESEYNQIKNNVDAASKVLERVPMINGKGEELGRKEAAELMYLKIQQQFLKDKADKDLPSEVKEKITKELSDVQGKIDKVYKGEFIDNAGIPFAGLEDREAKRKIKETTETAQEPVVLTETKPTEVKVAEEIKTDTITGKEPVIEEKGAEKKTLDSELRDALNYDFYESLLNSEDKWERENAKKYLADPKKYFESKIEDAKDVLSNNPENESSKNVLDNFTEKLRIFNEITNKYKQSTAKEPVIKGEAIPSEVKVTEESATMKPQQEKIESVRYNFENKNLQDLEIKPTKNKFVGDFLNDYDFLAKGSEHTVYKSKDGKNVIKIGEQYGSNEGFMPRVEDALTINNLIGDNSLEVIGYYENNGVKNPIYKQNFIDGKTISQQEVASYLESKGFVNLGNDKFGVNVNGKSYKISDTSDNFIIDKKGNIFAIDAAISELNVNELTKEQKSKLKEIVTVSLKAQPTELKVTEEVKPAKLPITEKIPEVTVEGTRRGYEVIAGNEANSIGDIREEAAEKRNNGEKFFIKKTVKDGKDIFTLVDTTVYDEFGRPGFKSASVEVPKNSRLSAEALMRKLKDGLGVTDKTNLQYLDKMTSEMKAEQGETAPTEKNDFLNQLKNINKDLGKSEVTKEKIEFNVTEKDKPTETKTVEQLRAEEQAEYDNMTNPNDKVRKKEIYDKYDKLITPLLEKPAETKVKEEKTFAQKDLDRAEAKKIHSRVFEMDPPVDAEQIALRYLSEGGKVSQDAINEVSGTVKRASLNTGRRELKTAEAKARDYAGGKESLDDLAHRLWENSGQEISERDIKDALMSEIGNNNTRLDASKTYLERYNTEYQQDKYYERFIEEEKEKHAKVQEELERDLRKPLEEETEGMSSEQHIDNLIKQYEAETKRENKQIGTEGKGEAVEEISSRDIGKEAPKEKELAKDYKETLEKVSKKAKENAKKDFVERNFDSIVEKLKIKIKCPT